jgi:hypothetical protein
MASDAVAAPGKGAWNATAGAESKAKPSNEAAANPTVIFFIYVFPFEPRACLQELLLMPDEWRPSSIERFGDSLDRNRSTAHLSRFLKAVTVAYWLVDDTISLRLARLMSAGGRETNNSA